ncbi:hypothetical protein AMAG_19167 [Allomyces macrogynus ATCC 38327]|uniref:Uncharacterized protein n=1 Tax=Allomyces macrogynus (strain ATCC 38327) TaxID=578462 RepID=A0A0L0SPR0_ALLM3|nr:hypothetical protein AMAG_19167 [Allomyces macrogynus ATCC 38327]|eukprot:KNE64486.1 hypothetical protein AMAG_19167 [Allomyces macrogynus ATCC 38327]
MARAGGLGRERKRVFFSLVICDGDEEGLNGDAMQERVGEVGQGLAEWHCVRRQSGRRVVVWLLFLALHALCQHGHARFGRQRLALLAPGSFVTPGSLVAAGPHPIKPGPARGPPLSPATFAAPPACTRTKRFFRPLLFAPAYCPGSRSSSLAPIFVTNPPSDSALLALDREF